MRQGRALAFTALNILNLNFFCGQIRANFYFYLIKCVFKHKIAYF
jgi:hypothetical protein